MREITLAVLAGGRGSRMGGPKGGLSIGGEPILGFLLSRLRWEGPTMLVLAPGVERPAGWEAFTSVAFDAVADQGPLRGVLTALEAATTDQVVICTVDMPGVEWSQLDWLIAQLDQRPDALAVMTSREQVEPFPSIFRKGGANVLRQRIDAKKLAVHSMAEDSRFAVVPAPGEWPERVWTNLNTPADLEAFLKSN